MSRKSPSSGSTEEQAIAHRAARGSMSKRSMPLAAGYRARRQFSAAPRRAATACSRSRIPPTTARSSVRSCGHCSTRPKPTAACPSSESSAPRSAARCTFCRTAASRGCSSGCPAPCLRDAPEGQPQFDALGTALGRLSRALRTFELDELPRLSAWDLQTVPRLKTLLGIFPSDSVAEALRRFDDRVEPRLA